jgi:hypothetical protein
VDKERLTWRSFADPRGDIAARWNLSATPALYVIDSKGTIRHKWVGGPGAKAIDCALEELIREAKGGGNGPPR